MTIGNERNPEKRNEMYNRMRLLNQKGESVETNTLDCPDNGQMIESELDCEAESDSGVTLSADQIRNIAKQLEATSLKPDEDGCYDLLALPRIGEAS